eukprot:145543-Amphidinium_carterae.1
MLIPVFQPVGNALPKTLPPEDPKIKDAHVSVLAELVHSVTRVLPMSAPTLRVLLNEKLKRLGAEQTVSVSWVRRFLQDLGLKYRTFIRQSAWKHDIPDDRVWNLDETVRRMFPLVPEDVVRLLLAWLVWDGIKHWQSDDSLLRFIQWMDGRVSESTPNLPWLIVFDVALIHVAVDFRKRLHTDLSWAKFCFVNSSTTCDYQHNSLSVLALPVTTSISQPLDRQIMRPLKHSLQEQRAQSFVAEIMLTLRNGGEFKLDAGLVGNRLRLPNRVEVAMTKTMARISLMKHRTWQ